MAGYIIGEVEVTDRTKYEEYIKVAPPTIVAYGGSYIVRAGKAENLEGDWDPKRIVVLEFDSFERAKEWWASEEYRDPKALRQSASISNIIVVESC